VIWQTGELVEPQAFNEYLKTSVATRD